LSIWSTILHIDDSWGTDYQRQTRSGSVDVAHANHWNDCLRLAIDDNVHYCDVMLDAGQVSRLHDVLGEWLVEKETA
jgi:hypothetical protein